MNDNFELLGKFFNKTKSQFIATTFGKTLLLSDNTDLIDVFILTDLLKNKSTHAYVEFNDAFIKYMKPAECCNHKYGLFIIDKKPKDSFFDSFNACILSNNFDDFDYATWLLTQHHFDAFDYDCLKSMPDFSLPAGCALHIEAVTQNGHITMTDKSYNTYNTHLHAHNEILNSLDICKEKE